MNVRYRIELSQTERSELAALLSGGKQAAARKLKRAIRRRPSQVTIGSHLQPGAMSIA